MENGNTGLFPLLEQYGSDSEPEFAEHDKAEDVKTTNVGIVDDNGDSIVEKIGHEQPEELQKSHEGEVEQQQQEHEEDINVRNPRDQTSSAQATKEDTNVSWNEFLAGLQPEYRVPQSEVDPRVGQMVEKWIRLQEQGLAITDDLRRRKWYKSPDCMRSMMDKFDIDDKGSNLEEHELLKSDACTLGELQRQWEDYDRSRKNERRAGHGRIEFQSAHSQNDTSKKYDTAALDAAVAAAKAKAAAYSSGRR